MELQLGLMCNVKIQRDDMPSVPALPPSFAHCLWAASQGKVGSSPSPAELPTGAPLGVDWPSRISADLSADGKGE